MDAKDDGPSDAEMKKSEALEAILIATLHSKDDLVLIVKTLNSTDPFRVLCGCVALDKFLQEEQQFEKLNYQQDKGILRIDPERSKP